MSEMVYKLSSKAHGIPHDLDFQAIGSTIKNIREKYGENGTGTKMIVAEAKREDSPLHAAGFTWDVNAAAEKTWIEEARYLVRSIVIEQVVEDEVREVRAFVSIVERDSGEDRYLTTEEVRLDPEYREQIIERALEELQRWRWKYDDLQELAPFFAAIDKTTRQYRHAEDVMRKKHEPDIKADIAA